MWMTRPILRSVSACHFLTTPIVSLNPLPCFTFLHALNISWHFFYIYLFISCLPHQTIKLIESRYCLLSTVLHPRCLPQCLDHRWCSTNRCWTNYILRISNIFLPFALTSRWHLGWEQGSRAAVPSVPWRPPWASGSQLHTRSLLPAHPTVFCAHHNLCNIRVYLLFQKSCLCTREPLAKSFMHSMTR